jgi:hypothetical protein
MYPALVLIIVNTERSIVNTFGFDTAGRSNLNGEGQANGNSAEHHPAAIGNLVFATKSTVDNEGSLPPRDSSFPGGLGSSDSHLNMS